MLRWMVVWVGLVLFGCDVSGFSRLHADAGDDVGSRTDARSVVDAGGQHGQPDASIDSGIDAGASTKRPRTAAADQNSLPHGSAGVAAREIVGCACRTAAGARSERMRRRFSIHGIRVALRLALSTRLRHSFRRRLG